MSQAENCKINTIYPTAQLASGKVKTGTLNTNINYKLIIDNLAQTPLPISFFWYKATE